MAKVDIKMPEDFLIKISRLGSAYDAIAEKALKAGGEIVLAKTKTNLSAVIGQDTKEDSRSTGELEEALGLSPVFQDRNGDYNIKIGFAEPRSDGRSNAKIANVIEYGRHGQPAKPFLKPARSSSRRQTISIIKQIFEEEVEKL